MNKEDLINEIRECRFGVNESITDIDELWVWINQNYIPKQQILNLECLKEEKHGHDCNKNIPELKNLPCDCDNGLRNNFRKEIKKEIEKL